MYIDCESVYSSSSAVKQTSETLRKKLIRYLCFISVDFIIISKFFIVKIHHCLKMSSFSLEKNRFRSIDLTCWRSTNRLYYLILQSMTLWMLLLLWVVAVICTSVTFKRCTTSSQWTPKTILFWDSLGTTIFIPTPFSRWDCALQLWRANALLQPLPGSHHNKAVWCLIIWTISSAFSSYDRLIEACIVALITPHK